MKAQQDNEKIIPFTTLEKWSKLAEKLKTKLEVTQRENEELKDRLSRKSAECEDLRDEHAFQMERIDDLEFQCLEKSAKISNLSEILEIRGDTSELQEKLLSKSLEHAELSLSVDRLRLALQKAESTNQKLVEEKETLMLVNEELSKKVEDYASAWERSSKEQERNRKLLIDMGDVVRTLNCATIEFEKESREGQESPHQNPLQNIKRKIQAMEADRQRLIRECESLRQENDSNHLRIEELESQFLSYSTVQTSDSGEFSQGTSQIDPLDSRIETQTSPVSIETEILNQVDIGSATKKEEYDDENRTDASNLSSFSDLEPPHIPLQEHQTLKQYYEEALERIVRMSAELGKSKAVIQELQEKDTYLEELRERLEQMKIERDEANKENVALEQQLQEALGLAEIAARKHDDIVNAHEKQLEEQRRKYQAMKDKYNGLETEYSSQLEELEKQVVETEKFFQLKCEGLKQQHLDKMEEALKEKNEIDKTHKEALKAEKEKYLDLDKKHKETLKEALKAEEKKFINLQKKHKEALEAEHEKYVDLENDYKEALKFQKEKFDGLNDEFDVFMEIHTELEDEMSGLKKKYDEALTNIVDLEQALKATKDKGEAEKTKLEKRIDEQLKVIKELKANVTKSKEETQEAIVQQQNLRRDYENVLAKHGDLVAQLNKVKEQKQHDEDTIKGLRENCYDMECRLKRMEQDASTRFHQLQASYEMAMAKVSGFAAQLHGAGLPIGESIEGPIKKENLPAHERIRLLEQELLGDDALRCPAEMTVDPEIQRFQRDYCQILRNLASGKKEKSKVKTILWQPLWYYRLVHHTKVSRVHENLENKGLHSQEIASNHEMNTLLLDFIRHQRGLQPILQTLITSVQSRLDAQQKTIQDMTTMLRNESSPARGGTDDSLLKPSHTSTLAYCKGSKSLFHDEFMSSSVETVAFDGHSEGQTHTTYDDTNISLQQIKGETQTINMAANTAKIRYEAREKEHRLVRLQYQKLLEQYNEALKNQNNDILSGSDDGSAPSLKVKMAVEKIHKDAELQRLQTELRAAELKVERMTLELRASKSKAEDAKKRQQEGEKCLQDAIVRHEKQLDADPPVATSPCRSSSQMHEAAVTQIFRSKSPLSIVEERREEECDGDGNGNESSCKLDPSFDGSQLTSFGGISSTEARDERCEDNKSGKVHFEGGIGRYLQLQQEHDEALRTIEQLKLELAEAEQSAESARAQVKQREDDLRDVIREYNLIKNESERLFAQIQDEIQKEKETNDDADDEEIEAPPVVSEDLIRERNMALGKISMLESELEKAVSAAKAAKKKQLLREDHLRQVIDQYKQLDQEHKKTKEQVLELQAALAQYSPTPGMETRQKSHESEDYRRENPAGPRSREHLHVNFQSDETVSKSSEGGSKLLQKMKRKAWFRDLGHGHKSTTHPNLRNN